MAVLEEYTKRSTRSSRDHASEDTGSQRMTRRISDFRRGLMSTRSGGGPERESGALDHNGRRHQHKDGGRHRSNDGFKAPHEYIESGGRHGRTGKRGHNDGQGSSRDGRHGSKRVKGWQTLPQKLPPGTVQTNSYEDGVSYEHDFETFG